jgi:two-component system chemotaxis response regulator CheY
MKKVLIIDDASTVRLYHRSLLEDAGFAVDEAVNGIEGIEKALQDDYDLFVVDVNMPKMDGYAFLQDVRSRSEIRQSPAVMVSTEAAEKDREKAFAAGANFYLTKPTQPERLIKIVCLLTGVPA